MLTTANRISSFKKSDYNVSIKENFGHLIFETPPKEKLLMLSVDHPVEMLSANAFGACSPFCEMEIEVPAHRNYPPNVPVQSPSHFMFKNGN